MLNSKAKLSEHIFGKRVEKKALRDGYGLGLLLAGEENKNVVVLCADLKESTRSHLFAQNYPERFFEMGVAEQNMAAVASGLAVAGKIPFISSYATFSPGRNWEQIRTLAAYNNASIKIAGHHAGISVGPDGATHQAIEDIATMRVVANMKIFTPCDAIEARKATLAAAKISGPIYIRLAREKTPVFTTDETPFVPGGCQVFWQSKNPRVLLVSCGALTHAALLAAKELEEEKIGSIVLNVSTVKPLDEKRLVELAGKAEGVVTVEEHSIVGGLGGAVAEVLARECPKRIVFIGMRDTFGESGSSESLLEKYGMDVRSIKGTVAEAVGDK